jgi:hypothetical protein
MDVYCVPIEAINSVWSTVELYLSKALKKNDAEYDLHDVKTALNNGKWKLFVSVNDQDEIHGAAVVSFLSYPKTHVAFITCLGGKMLINQECFNKFKDLLKSYGADRLQGFVDNSIERLYKRINLFRKAALVEMKI